MLPEAKCSFLRNNFLVRMLYTDVYWHFSVFTLLFDVPPLRLLMTFNKETDWLIDWLIDWQCSCINTVGRCLALTNLFPALIGPRSRFVSNIIINWCQAYQFSHRAPMQGIVTWHDHACLLLNFITKAVTVFCNLHGYKHIVMNLWI